MKNINFCETEEYILFYGGIFSQWYKRDMIIDGVVYCTCEQFMMAEKAKLFNDDLSLSSIMNSKEPAEQKALGRKVKGFNKDQWDKICRDVVYRGNYAKFSQHKDLKEILLKTNNKIIAEASPYDRIWGIGLKATDERALNSSKWEGTNWLGEAIMKVRSEIKENRKKLLDISIDMMVENEKRRKIFCEEEAKIYNDLNDDLLL